MNANAGGWKKSELRQKMNSGEIWNLMPSELQSKVKAVKKLTNNIDGLNKNATVTATVDKLFLLSRSEITKDPRDRRSKYSLIYNEGDQYEVFKDRTGTSSFGYGHERTITPAYSSYFLAVSSSLNPDLENLNTNGTLNVCPAWCF